jgi:putative PIN family toxin of toxin-antitoxin system
VRRAVLDSNILISALLSPPGAPARLVAHWLAGEFELVVSERLLTELERALAYPKLRARISADDATAFVEFLRESADIAADPTEAHPAGSPDPGDDYLIALAAASKAVLVSGDRHLLGLRDRLSILAAQAFLEALAEA